MAFFNKYPYTDFHELNADWILKQLSTFQTQLDEFTQRVIECEEQVAAISDRMDQAEEDIDALEGRMDTAEGDISDLKDADIALDGRLDALEGADIQDAVMLSDMAGITRDTSSVTIGFTKNTYTDGAKGADVADNAVIPAATTDYAGVITAGDKAKLNAFSVDGSGNATFTGTVGGSAPSGNNDYATKQYVDNLAISGQASAVYENDIKGTYDEAHGTWVAHSASGLQYGSVREVRFRLSATLDQDRTAGTAIVWQDLTDDYYSEYGYYHAIATAKRTRDNVVSYIPVELLVGDSRTPSTNYICCQAITTGDWLNGDTIDIRGTATYMVY